MAKHEHENEPLPPGVPKTTKAPKAPRLRRPPFKVIALLVVAVVASWVPIVLIARGKTTKSTEPRVHLVQDMGSQPKYREQQSSPVFADGRADRPRLAGTVAHGQADLLQDDEYDFYTTGFRRELPEGGGKAKTVFATEFPKRVVFDAEGALLKRGQDRYNIYCSTCHGFDGYAKGMTAVRSAEIGSPISPSSLHDETVRARPVGHLYNSITEGIRNMGSYKTQLSIEDRWAVVAYVRALQQTQMKK